METQHNNNTHRPNGGGAQNISVKPGNFVPPNAAQGGGKKHRNRHRGGHRGGQNTPQGERQSNPQNTQQVQQNNRPNNNRQGWHHRKNHNRHEQSAPRTETPALSETLQLEPDEDFASISFSDSLLSRNEKKNTVRVEDTHEFEVDIATAAYLVEDIPNGFPAPDAPVVEVIGVRFRQAGKVYFFTPCSPRPAVGDFVVVDTARGPELGEVVMPCRRVAERNLVQPLRGVLRMATKEDAAHEAENRAKEAEAVKICAEKIAAHKLDMHLVDAQYTFDNTKLLFYFTAEGRVDFRDLVRDLAGVFRTRIELRQIGIREESRMVGGLGPCGRPFCCATFLSDFGQVSVKMAKEQGLSINTAKLSGCCGRLLCCLRYEQESYRAETALTPAKDTHVQTPDGAGVVTETAPIAGTVKVRLDAAPDEATKTYRRDDVTTITQPESGKAAENS